SEAGRTSRCPYCRNNKRCRERQNLAVGAAACPCPRLTVMGICHCGNSQNLFRIETMLFKNIALGVYYPGNSLIHRLQARTKLLALFWLVAALMVANQRPWHFVPYIAIVVLLSIDRKSTRLNSSH